MSAIHRALRLTDDEEASIEKIFERPPNHLERAMYAVMWSEQCSYKSSRLHLRRLPTEASHVLVGPPRARRVSVLTATGITGRYTKPLILRDASLTVDREEIVACAHRRRDR